MKASSADKARRFEDIPNIGPAMARDFRALGLREPKDLTRKNAYSLYQAMCRQSGVRQDPCVLDTYMAAIDFMNGAPARPWWHYTQERKKKYPRL